METQKSMSFLYEENHLVFSIKSVLTNEMPYCIIAIVQRYKERKEDFPRKNLIFLNVSLTVFLRKKVMVQSL